MLALAMAHQRTSLRASQSLQLLAEVSVSLHLVLTSPHRFSQRLWSCHGRDRDLQLPRNGVRGNID